MTNKFNQLLGSLLLISALFLGGCDSGGGSNNSDPAALPADPDDTAVSGAAVKGPLIGAEVNVYLIDHASAGLKGRLIASGTTDDSARLTGIAINTRRLDPAFLLEIVGGTDLTTGEASEVSTLRTIITAQALSNGQPVYATPLTTFLLAYVQQTASDADGSGSVSVNEYMLALDDASTYVQGVFGFGVLDGTVDLFLTAPIFDGNTPQLSSLDYRSASEAFTALVLLLEQQGSDSADEIIQALAEDLADGLIDGLSSGQPLEALADISDVQGVVTQDPAGLMIPGTSRNLSELPDLLAEEAEQLFPSVEPEALTMPVLLAVVPGTDTDGDRVLDINDACPDDASEFSDRDGDNFCDGKDRFPDDASEWADIDDDGVGDNEDACDPGAKSNYGFFDGDGDGYCALLLPEDEGGNALRLTADYDDTDPDVWLICQDEALTEEERELAGCGVDTDGDGEPDVLDNCPAISNPGQENQDSDLGDTEGDACDDDRDGDGVDNDSDAFPDDRSGWLDCGDGEPATICGLPLQLSSWLVDNIFATGTDESVGIIEGSFALQDNVITGSVSLLSLGGNLAGFTYVGDWVIDLGAGTISAANNLCTDTGPQFSGCGLEPFAVGGSSDAAFVFGTVNVTVVDNGNDSYTVTWEAGDQVQNVHNWTFTVQ